MRNIEIISLAVIITSTILMSLAIGYGAGHRDGYALGYGRGKAVHRHVSAK